MKSLVKKFSQGFRKVLTTFIAILTGMNVITIVLQVVFRYFFSRPIAWANELAGISLVWITFLGATLATMDQTNIGFDAIKEKLGPKGGLVLKLVCNALVLVACGVIFRYGLTAVKGGLKTSLVSLPANFAVAVSVVPICAAFMFLATIVNSVKDIQKVFKAGNESFTVDQRELNAIYDDVPEEILQRSEAALKQSEDGEEDVR